MTRLFYLALVVTLACHVPIKAQEKKDPPKHFTNSIGMKFAWIPPDTFLMGSPKEEKARIDEWETQHKATLSKGFYMAVHLVTQEQWQAVMGNNPSKFKGEKNLPVESVSWDDCQEFIKKLREKDKKAYRLPSEAEWEYACRAGTKTPFWFGETISTDQANYNGDVPFVLGEKKGVYRKKTTPVGSFPANAFGLYDMHGNVWEWCQDWFGDYPQNDVIDPPGPKVGERRVVRGGSLHEHPFLVRSAQRYSFEPGKRWPDCGLRVCFFVEEKNGEPKLSPGQAGRDNKPAAPPAGKLTKSQFDKVKSGMTLTEVMALLGPHAEINPDPAPCGYVAPEVLVLWRDGKTWGRWASVIFIPDKNHVLRVLADKDGFVGGGSRGSNGLTD